jgi:integrase/recombinase XerD
MMSSRLSTSEEAVMNDPMRVRVTGPLARYADGFRAELAARGYAPGSQALQLQLAAELSRWLEVQGLGAGGLTPERVSAFFEMRRARVRVLYVSPRALGVLLDHLGEVGALPVPEPVPVTPLEALLDRYRGYLLRERGLAERTAARYVHVARRFLTACSEDGDAGVAGVSAAAAVAFLTAECAARSTGWAGCVAVALRSLLRFLHLEGLISQPLAQAVPAPAGWRLAGLPKALTPVAVSSLLASCDRGSAAGRRDYAVLLLLARLGLRAGEIAALQLADVGWRDGRLRVRGKGSRTDVLPLPADVGRALADYVLRGRPLLAGGAIFRRMVAPHRALSPTTVTGIVYRACDRAGLPHAGAHRLRHTAATQMLGAGASLPEIAQVLRHASLASTAIYAKSDRKALAALARPWPGQTP